MLIYFLFDLFKCKSHSSLSKVIEVKIMHDRYISAVFKMLSEVNFVISTHLFLIFLRT
ncbi:hypothetical protein BANRA_00707 [Escherichia coli]|nr:hypothetical protein BANRA_00707 [Escherichia coli]